jgi:hypothetical protein
MRPVIMALTAATIALCAQPAIAGPNCTCRANGTKFEIGQVACITLPSGTRLAQCEMVLNNTSWKVLGDSCPTTRLEKWESKSPASSPQSPGMISGLDAISG